MLRVEIRGASNTTYLRVEGRFVGAFAEDLRAMLLRCKVPNKLVVDLTEVTFVDTRGEEVLRWLGSIGARFLAENCYSLDLSHRLHLPMVPRRRINERR